MQKRPWLAPVLGIGMLLLMGWVFVNMIVQKDHISFASATLQMLGFFLLVFVSSALGIGLAMFLSFGIEQMRRKHPLIARTLAWLILGGCVICMIVGPGSLSGIFPISLPQSFWLIMVPFALLAVGAVVAVVCGLLYIREMPSYFAGSGKQADPAVQDPDQPQGQSKDKDGDKK